MASYDVHTLDTAPADAKPLLEAANKNFGFVPNLLGVMAEAPAILEGYLTLNGIFDKTSLSATEKQIVLMTSNFENQCHYCMAAHSVIAGMQGVDSEVIDALREGRPLADPKLEALRVFARTTLVNRGWVADADIQALIDAGYSKATALEVVVGLAVKVMSNYTNHIAHTPVDDTFASQSWTHPDKREAAE